MKEKKIVIVGSSDIMLENNLGSEIDNFDIVVRFNRAPVFNFENYVGSKTDVRFVNSHAVKNTPKQNEDLKFLPSVKNQIICSDFNINDNDFYRVFDKSCTYKQINRFSNFKKFKNNILDKLDINLNMKAPEPSVGLNAICYYINEGYIPTIYGFHLHDENRNVSPHYWKKKLSVGGCHDFSYERKLIKELINLNYLKLLK